MKIHLRILYGADDRFEIVKHTLNVCQGYFDTIKLINSGPVELYNKLTTILPNNGSVEQLNYYCGDIESARNAFLYDVDIDDWVFWLDADERPSQHLLNNLDKIIKESDQRDIFIVKPTFISHYFLNNKQHTDWKNMYGIKGADWDFEDTDVFAKNAEDYGDLHIKYNNKKTPYIPIPTVCRLFKKKTHFASADSNFGGHGQILNYRGDIRTFYVPYAINHLKHEIMVYQSCTTCVYFNPTFNANTLNSRKHYMASLEYKKLREFQKKTGVKTQNDLCNNLYINPNFEFKEQFKELCECEEFKNSNLENNLFKHYPEFWSKRYDLNWETPFHDMYCGKLCCKYNNIQL
jgi:hypothetical protein